MLKAKYIFLVYVTVLIAACTGRQPTVGSSFQDTLLEDRLGPIMVVLPSGTFLMGSPPDEEKRYDTEGPRQTVTISKPFAVGKFEVTVAEYLECVSSGGCRPPQWQESDGKYVVEREPQVFYEKHSTMENPIHPIIGVSWFDAKEYVNWLNESMSGEPYRLLSEAEWEYAARAGTFGRFGNNGSDEDLCSIANFADVNTDSFFSLSCDDGYGKHSAPVGSFSANIFGLHDMHGNVFEWVEDCLHRNYKGAPEDGNAWVTNCDSNRRMYRGGSYASAPGGLRSARRLAASPDTRSYDIGFRIAKTLR